MTNYINYSVSKIQIVPDETKKGSVLKISKDVKPTENPKQVDVLYEQITLSDILADDISDEQRTKIRNTLQLVEQDQISKGYLPDDRQKICYFNGNLYGVKRLIWRDVTSSNQRTSYEASNESAPINGSGSANFSSASNQWLTIFFASRKTFKVICRHTNNNWAVRQLDINNSTKNLTASSGTYTYTYIPANGWQDINRIQFVDNGGNTILNDLQILYANPVFPTLTNGEVLEVGDFFKVEGDKQLLRFDGVDSASGAWKAVPVSSSDKLDVALSSTSTNGVENKAIYWGIENLRLLLTEQIEDQAIASEVLQYIELQLLVNALAINRIDTLFDAYEKQLLLNAISINRIDTLFQTCESLQQELEEIKRETNGN